MARADNVVSDLISKILEQNNVITKDVDIKPISTEGANYTTELYTIKLITNNENLDLFAKVAIISGEMRIQMNADRIYATERFVYEKLEQIYETLQLKYKVPEEHRFVFPKCYGINSEQGQETVLLENLTLKGYKPYNRFKSMDWAHGAISMEMLAKFHALSFAYKKENPNEFRKLVETMVYKPESENDHSEKLFSVWVQMVDRSMGVIDDEHKGKIRALLMQKDFLEKYNKPNQKTVLCHGDYRLSNILFRHEGESLRAIPVDYQTVYSGCPPADVVYFIFMGSDEEFRRQYYHQLVNHYYDSLCQALRRLDMDPVEEYPRDTFDEQMKECLPYVLFLGVALLPVVTVEAESAPRMNGDADVTTFVVELNDLYASRFRGIVKNCIEWGII